MIVDILKRLLKVNLYLEEKQLMIGTVQKDMNIIR